MTKFAQGNTRAAKLSNEQVLEIRQLYHDEGWSQGTLSRRYQVGVNTIGRIVRGESRQRVPMPAPSLDHAAIQARMLAIQEAREKEILDKLTTDIAKEPAIQDKYAELALEHLAKYGITKE